MSDFDKRRHWIRLPGRSAERIRREVDEELRSHIEMRAAAFERTGMSAADACARAEREFGDLDDTTRYCAGVDRAAEQRRRAGDWISELRQDARHAIRILTRAPAFAMATVLTLALAIGASTAVYGVLHTYLVRPLPFPEADRLMSVMAPPTFDRSPRPPSLNDVDWASADSLFDATTAWDIDGFTIAGSPYAESMTGAWVPPGYFRAVSARPAVGRGFLPDEYRDHAAVAIISHNLWVRRFNADSGVIGTTVSIHSLKHPDAGSAVTIVGVMGRDFWPIHWRESEVIRPMRQERSSMPLLVRLKPEMSRLNAQQRLDAVVRAQLQGNVDPAWHMTLVPVLDRYSAGVQPLLTTVFGAALFMLLAACGSVAGALVSRMAARQHELSVRTALGGSRARIVRQLLTESAVLAILAGLLGLLVAYLLLDVTGPLIERQLGTKVPGGAAALRPTALVMASSLIVSTLAGIGLGFVPAFSFLRLGRTSAAAVLGAGRTISARSGSLVRRILIAGQVAVAMVLLFGAGLMLQTVERMAATPLGFRADGVMTATILLSPDRYPDSTVKQQAVDRILARVAETRGVQRAAVVFPRPFGTMWRLPVTSIEGVAVNQESPPKTMVYTVSPSYFETMNVPLRAGRTFRTTDDRAAPLAIVISEELARIVSPDGNAVGRRIRVRVPLSPSFDDHDEMPWRTVIGVVGDTKKEFAAGTLPDVYVPYAQNPRTSMAIIARTDSAESSIVEPVRRAVASVEPSLALSSIASMADIVADESGQRRGLTVLLSLFATFALGLSALALYASLSFAVLQRRSELAVRMAIGASERSILALVVGEGLATAAIGVAGGVAASLALGRVLEHQLYGVGTADPATLVAISLVLTGAAVAACIAPGLRAVRTDPALALRK